MVNALCILPRAGLTKTMRVMQLTAIILLGICLQVSASGLSQSITLKGDNLPLEKVLQAVESQTGLLVSYKANQLKNAKPVTVRAINAPLVEFLQMVLKDQPFEYVIEENTIFIRKKEKSGAGGVLKDAAISPSLNPPPVTGIIRGPDGQPLAGVNIIIKGTKKGTVSGADGSFSIEAKEGEICIISSVGFADKIITIGSNASVGIIALDLSQSKLDEVQIIAYGQTSMRLNTGNVTSIKSDEIAKQPINNPLYALQGRVPGLQVTPTSGLAGAPVNLQIRGQNTLRSEAVGSGAANPLIVINGLPVDNNIPGLGFEALQQLSSLNFLNSNDIESIDVLKDADATSVYGSRGANGVIMITTRQAKAGQTKVDINVQSGIGYVNKKIELLKTQQYLELRREAYANSGVDLSTAPNTLSRADVKFWDQNRYTDWQEKLIGGNARFNDFQASVSGGTSSVQYLIGGTFHKETTVFPGNNNDQKSSAYLNLSGTSPNRKFKSTVSATYLVDNNKLPALDFTPIALKLAPNAPSVYDENGALNWEPLPSGNSSWDNPYSALERTCEAKITNLMASGNISYEVIPDLLASARVGYSEINGNSFRKTFPFAGRRPEEGNVFASASTNSNHVTSVSFEPQLTYNKNLFGGHAEILLGASFQSTTTEAGLINAAGFTSDALLRSFGSADPTRFIVSNTSSQYKYSAIYGRIKYNFQDRYIFSFNGRRDGSSRFGPGKQFGNFGSIGAAWIVSSESFAKPLLSVLSFAKIRTSYGSSGNDGIDDYAYLERYIPNEGPENYQGIRGYETTGLFNSYYAWEVTRKAELGIDIGFLKDRFLLSAAYFRNRSDNQLLSYPFPSMVGPGSTVYNLPALIQNMGWEFSINSQNIKSKHFNWSSGFNFSRLRNKLISFDNLQESLYYADFEIGQPFFGFEKFYAFEGTDPHTGKYVFTDVQGKVVEDPFDASRLDFGKYKRIWTQPDFFGGLSNTISWKNFSLYLFLQFSKQKGLNPIHSFLTTAGTQTNLPVEYYGRWQQPGDHTKIGQLLSTGSFNQNTFNLMASDEAYVDASFIRLKTLSVSYTLGERVKRYLHLNNLRIYVQGQNLITITNYKGLDPEMQFRNLPPLTVMTAGVHISL